MLTKSIHTTLAYFDCRDGVALVVRIVWVDQSYVV
jgi:hypothetical protein